MKIETSSTISSSTARALLSWLERNKPEECKLAERLTIEDKGNGTLAYYLHRTVQVQVTAGTLHESSCGVFTPPEDSGATESNGS